MTPRGTISGLKFMFPDKTGGSCGLTTYDKLAHTARNNVITAITDGLQRFSDLPVSLTIEVTGIYENGERFSFRHGYGEGS